MFELAAALITLFSASIFLAHAVEAYYAKWEARDRSPASSCAARHVL